MYAVPNGRLRRRLRRRPGCLTEARFPVLTVTCLAYDRSSRLRGPWGRGPDWKVTMRDSCSNHPRALGPGSSVMPADMAAEAPGHTS